ncbi:MAG: YqaA family protein [Alphaproteobacteria bacterium]
MSNPLRRLYEWTMKQAAGPQAEKALAGVSFAESSFFPIPPDVMLVPMILAAPDKAWRLAGICTVASVLGGLLGYAIGYFLYETAGLWLMNLYGMENGVAEFRAMYNAWGAWIILLKGLTPIPFKLVTIASGVAGYNLLWFVVLSTITRAARFYLVAALLYWGGPTLREFVEKRLEIVMLAALAAVVVGFVAVEWIL